MPGNQDTLDIFNTPDNEASARILLGLIDKIDERMKSVSGINIMGKAGNAGAARQQSQEMAAGLQQIAEMQQKLITLENQLAEAKKRSSTPKAKTDEEIRAKIEAAEATRQQTAAIKDQIKYDQAETDSIIRKRIELKQLQATYDRLSQTSGDTDALNNTKNQVKALSDELKKLEGDTGRFQRNVGNYSEALKPLEEEFKRVTAAMSAMQAKGVQNLGARNPVGFDPNKNKPGGTTSFTNSGGQNVSILNEDAEAYQKLTQQAGYLNTILQKNEKGFSSVTQQIRFNERALISLREAGLEGSEAFAQLREQTVESAREMKEFQRQQKLLESELPALKALTLAAKGLGGAYAIGAGTAALFADGNEKVEKEMAKLVAIMTVLQGLGEAWELIQMRGAAAAAFHEAATVGLTGAMEVYETVVDGAIAATTSLDAAMMATGIGALVVALGGLIYLIANAKESTEEYIEAQKKLNEQLEHYYDAIVKVNQSLDEELKKEDEVAKKALEVFTINARTGKAQDEVAAKKKAIAEQDIKTADAVAEKLQKELGITGKLTDAQDDLQGQYDEQMSAAKASLELQKEYGEQLEKQKHFVGPHGEGPDPRITEELKENVKREQEYIDLYQKQAAAIKVKLDRVKEVTKAQEDGAQALKILDAEEQKRQFEMNQERIAAIHEITQETRRQTAEYLAMQADIGVSEQQRLKALAAEKVLREQMIIADRNQQLEAKNLNRANLTKVEQAERMAIIVSYNEKIFALDVDFLGREAIMRKEFRDRDVNEANFTNEELLKKREQYYKDQETLANQHAANQKDAAETDRDQRLKALEELHVGRNPAGENKTELENYQHARLAIETEANDKIFKSQEELIKKQIALKNQKEEELQRQPTNSPEQAKKQAEEIAQIEQDKNDLSTKYNNLEWQREQNLDNQKEKLAQDRLAKRRAMAEQEMQLGKQVEETVSAFVHGAYEAQIQNIERQIRKNNELHEAESARIQNSTLQESAKAAQMEILQRQTADRNLVLQRKENEARRKEAQFDRDKAVLDVTANTAVAIMKEVSEWGMPAAIPWIAITAAMGAAQVAAILAKPIPKFEAGTDYSPEGLAMLHPGEMRIDPSGKISMTPDAPESLAYLEKGTKIIPRHRQDDMNDILLASIFGGGATAPADNRLFEEVRGMKEVIAQSGRDTVAALKKQKPAHVDVHVDANFLTYIKTCL